VVDNGAQAVALVESDNQGAFAAYELGRGAVGAIDIARAVEALRPALAADHIVIASDHSHAGQDLIGVWGGVPNEYLEYVKTRPDGSTIATLVNFAAHSTVMGSGNRLVSADWPGPTADKVEAALGGTAVVMPAANGRTQPDRPAGTDVEKLDAYSTTISGLAL